MGSPPLINSDDGEMMRHLYHEAGKTQKYGQLSDDEALALITINPAKQLGIESRTGSLEQARMQTLRFSKIILSLFMQCLNSPLWMALFALIAPMILLTCA